MQLTQISLCHATVSLFLHYTVFLCLKWAEVETVRPPTNHHPGQLHILQIASPDLPCASLPAAGSLI